jgi:alpha-methylacyl-CoA racemase
VSGAAPADGDSRERPPLDGIRVVEIAAIGPAPFGVMLLADLGADVVRVDRVESVRSGGPEVSMRGLARGRRSAAFDLQRPEGLDLLLQLASQRCTFLIATSGLLVNL